MSEPENIGAVLQRTLEEISPELRKKILQKEIFNRWHEIFKSIADKFSPVEIQGETLIVTSTDGALMDALKFGAGEFVKLINDKVSPDMPIISDIKFGKGFAAPPPVKEIPAEPVQEEIILTPEEIAECEEKVSAVNDENLRQTLLETMLSYVKSQKRKVKNGWHKCKLCNVLCPPKENICNICAIKERERMVKEIRKIFLTAPETHFREIQQRMARQFPYLECKLETIESARMDLILQYAAKVSYNVRGGKIFGTADTATAK